MVLLLAQQLFKQTELWLFNIIQMAKELHDSLL